MKIGVVSDTHSLAIPKQVLEAFRSVDFIIHAGDFSDLTTLKSFEKIKEVKAVFGNTDGADIRNRFPSKQFIPCGKFILGVYHGEGAAVKIVERVQKEFAKDKLDVVIFGHSHQPFNEKIDGVLYFNPGSPNDTITAPYCSYGILDLTEKGVKARIVKL